MTAVELAAPLVGSEIGPLREVIVHRPGLELDRITVHELAAMSFPAGSMGPKIEVCQRFVQAGGERAAIGALGAAAVLAGTAGTSVLPEPAAAKRVSA